MSSYYGHMAYSPTMSVITLRRKCVIALDGIRKTTRYQSIEVEFFDRNFKQQKQNFTGLAAQIIQHEIDHCDGILI